MADAGTATRDLPPVVERVLRDFTEAARRAFGEQLLSIVLFGSAAEGRMRATSDVNLIVVLSRYDPSRVDAFREPLRVARAAARVSVMFLLEGEASAAAETFAVKFDDISHRRRILFGTDPFATLTVPRTATVARLRQVLLNLTLRLRADYALKSDREEQLAWTLADAAGPVRACAATILELERGTVVAPKEALEQLTATLDGDWHALLSRLSEAREMRAATPGTAAPALLRLIALTEALRARVDELASS